MALDKQRILNELGSVMNQLQSADCGCMDKLFTNPGQGGSPGANHMGNYSGYGHGCCHGHGYGHHYGSYNRPCAGEPYTAMNANQMGMGRCNPPKLYADTYNYLNQNLMQPVVKDVYNDLKNLTPANAVANNPMAGQMGLSAQGNVNPTAGEMDYPNQGNTANPMTSGTGGNEMQNMSSSSPGMMGNHMGHLAGMGPHIVNMMTGDGKSKPANVEGQAPGGPLTGPMVIDAPNSPYGQVGVTPLNQSSGYDQGQLNTPMDASYANQGYTNFQPQSQTVQNMYGTDTRYNSQMNPMTTNVAQNEQNPHQTANMISNPAAQQMSNAQRNPHGMHTQGVAKFNEMFPGVMQGLGGDLGFDPMAIAIQMNPANQQKVAMDTMQKIMNGSNVNKVLDPRASSAIQPAINGVNAAAASFTQPPPTENVSGANQQVIPNHQTYTRNNEIVPGQNQQVNYQMNPNQPQMQQQLYTAVTGNNMNSQEFQRYSQLPPQELAAYQAQQVIDPRNASHMPEGTERSHQRDPSEIVHQNPPPQAMIKDPIFPVDTSKNTVSPSLIKTKYFEYNTLGQPVEMLPAKMYHTQEPNLPQTLSPQPSPTRKREDYMKYSNVKSTVSKTSLMANKPIGRVPSRNQLQQIYNQYKGSQSFTQQSIKAPSQGATLSEGHIVANQGQPTRQRVAPVERVGDVVNNVPPATLQKVEQVTGKIGDVPAQKPPIQGEPEKPPLLNSNLRNGLQDMIYTSYPTSAAWSFHGNNRTPYYPGRRSRYRS